MKNIILTLFISLSIFSCTKLSETKEELGTVVDVIYLPGQHYSGSGISHNGDFVVTSGTTDDTYAVVFECEHKVKFSIKTPNSIAKTLYNQLHKNDKVKILYKEKLNSDNETVGYKFINAEKQ